MSLIPASDDEEEEIRLLSCPSRVSRRGCLISEPRLESKAKAPAQRLLYTTQPPRSASSSTIGESPCSRSVPLRDSSMPLLSSAARHISGKGHASKVSASSRSLRPAPFPSRALPPLGSLRATPSPSLGSSSPLSSRTWPLPPSLSTPQASHYHVHNRFRVHP